MSNNTTPPTLILSERAIADMVAHHVAFGVDPDGTRIFLTESGARVRFAVERPAPDLAARAAIKAAMRRAPWPWLLAVFAAGCLPSADDVHTAVSAMQEANVTGVLEQAGGYKVLARCRDPRGGSVELDVDTDATNLAEAVGDVRSAVRSACLKQEIADLVDEMNAQAQEAQAAEAVRAWSRSRTR